MDDARLLFLQAFNKIVLILGFAMRFPNFNGFQGPSCHNAPQPQKVSRRKVFSICMCMHFIKIRSAELPSRILPAIEFIGCLYRKERKTTRLTPQKKQFFFSKHLQNHPSRIWLRRSYPHPSLVRIPSQRRPREVPRGSWCLRHVKIKLGMQRHVCYEMGVYSRVFPRLICILTF